MLYFFSAVVFIIFVIICATASHKDSQSSTTTYTDQSFDDDYSSSAITSNRKPKIGAEVDEDLYDSVQSYCRNKSITISELIRRSVKSYMEDN